MLIVLAVLALLGYYSPVRGNSDAKRLFEDLFIGYNKLIRPVANHSELLKVKFKLRLSQLLDVHEKNQIMTTNVWLEHEWLDYKLTWNPSEYGNVTVLYVPGNLIWLPDLVLYNNADGNYQVTIITKATVHHTGIVHWEPPAIYKSMCQINVQWFPFDEQSCQMKFGSWTYDGFQVDLLHIAEDHEIIKYVEDNLYIECVENAIDLTDYYTSTEWDIIAVPGRKKKEKYPCCPTPYIDITYELHLRRKTLFYTINLIFPCIGISFLTVLVFYLPSDSSEKVTLSISILISLTVFFLLLVEIIPSTSLVVPLIGKYLLFTMVLVTLSICVTVVVINFHFRSPRTHTMSPTLRRWLIESSLPSLLWMTPRPSPLDPSPHPIHHSSSAPTPLTTPHPTPPPRIFQAEVKQAVRHLAYIAKHFQYQAHGEKVMDDWRFVAMVIDRMFLILFSIASVAGTACIILQAPSLYDERTAIDQGDQNIIHAMNGETFCGIK